MQEEQERQARQIKELETERLRQESLLQEKGAQIKVEVHFFLFCEIFSPVQKVLEDENVALVALLGNLKTQLSQVARYDSIATVGEIRVYWRADFQSGSRVLKKVF